MRPFLHFIEPPTGNRLWFPVLLFVTFQLGGNIMGKYVIAWILGVPAVVLAGIYLVAHVF